MVLWVKLSKLTQNVLSPTLCRTDHFCTLCLDSIMFQALQTSESGQRDLLLNTPNYVKTLAFISSSDNIMKVDRVSK